jgi:hypothetical protein
MNNPAPVVLRANPWVRWLEGISSKREKDCEPKTRRHDSRSHISRLTRTVRRHSVTTVGPLSISAAHFLATLAVLHWLPSRDFGQFSFVIVVVGLCLSLTSGLLGAPLSSIALVSPDKVQAELHTYFKASVALAGVLGLAACAIVLSCGASLGIAVAFGAYATTMSLRLFARSYAYTRNEVRKVVLSDCVYSIAILFGVGGILAFAGFHLLNVALVMASAAALALVPFGVSGIQAFVSGLRMGSVWAYGRVWRNMTRWSVLGVVTSEITVNAHAYIVTFVSGSRAFALLAVGALFMRPFNLVASALPDREGPVMARTIAGGDIRRALHDAKEYLFVIAALWAATQVLAAGVLAWYPEFVIRKGYDEMSVVAVVAVWAMITAVRGIRAPDVMLLIAAREFRPLANASAVSSVVALVSTFVLLVVAGPTASLFGILSGDLAMWLVIRRAVQRWKRSERIAPLLRNAMAAA